MCGIDSAFFLEINAIEQYSDTTNFFLLNKRIFTSQNSHSATYNSFWGKNDWCHLETGILFDYVSLAVWNP